MPTLSTRFECLTENKILLLNLMNDQNPFTSKWDLFFKPHYHNQGLGLIFLLLCSKWTKCENRLFCARIIYQRMGSRANSFQLSFPASCFLLHFILASVAPGTSLPAVGLCVSLRAVYSLVYAICLTLCLTDLSSCDSENTAVGASSPLLFIFDTSSTLPATFFGLQSRLPVWVCAIYSPALEAADSVGWQKIGLTSHYPLP